MRILSISNLPLNPYQGSGKTRIGWTEGLRKLNHDVKVLQPSDFEIWSSLKKGRKYRLILGILKKGIDVLNQNEYDIVEFFGDSYWLLLIWLRYMRQKTPLFVAHADGLELNDMEKELKFWYHPKGMRKLIYNTNFKLSRLNFSLADALVCNCESDKEYALKHDLFTSEQALCIPPGIDKIYHELEFIDKKEKSIVYLGTWINRKGVNLIPKVLTQILLTFPEYRFHIYGAWEAEERINNEFSDEVKDRVTVFGQLSKSDLLLGILKSAIYFFPSYSEGLPLATVEAMSCSCAVVTTPTGLGSNLIANKEAIICDFNDIEGMIRAISHLILNEEERRRIAYNGYVKSKEFVWESQVEKLENFYLSLLKNHA